ncbi:MAG: hypothetical protein QF807_01190 [Candidatus Thalassarchaeaceae archaeon]|nr:hypothetical protein [Candidatus Thalassarchaeaceae archaeon]MDP7042618.1 hypothetical protein [Candidatus Thalassarchaeaceae archaeon]
MSENMGLLEKAGQMQDEGKAKPAKASKPKPAKKEKQAKKPARRAKKAKVVDDLDDFEVKERVAKTLPTEYELAKRPARFARSLVDFIVTYGAFVGLFGTYLFIDGDFTYLWIVSIAIMLFNMIGMPIMTRRTVGNYASLTKYVNHKGNPPIFLHQTFKSLTILFILSGLGLILSAGLGKSGGLNSVNLGIGFAVLLIPFADWVVAKIRHETRQGIWDSMFFAYMVSHSRTTDEEATGFFGRLESSGDWLKDKGWLGNDDEEQG